MINPEWCSVNGMKREAFPEWMTTALPFRKIMRNTLFYNKKFASVYRLLNQDHTPGVQKVLSIEKGIEIDPAGNRTSTLIGAVPP